MTEADNLWSVAKPLQEKYDQEKVCLIGCSCQELLAERFHCKDDYSDNQNTEKLN